MKYIRIIGLIICFLPSILQAQIYGSITDPDGEPLPFANVYLKGTSIGTTSNVEGDYELDIEKGNYEVVYQYIGYQAKTINLEYTGGKKAVNVTLIPDAIDLVAVEVRADSEDPAYAIIRKAIAKRKYYKERVETYGCKVYIKGGVKILEAPESLFGQDIGDMGGMLDSTRQGYIYLSESESELYVQQPDEVKEIMISSKVSGDDAGFSFNSAGEMDFDFYKNTIDYGRPIISPIANNAMAYYRYRLVGVLYDDAGRLINKIEVLPKHSEDPSYAGLIYIVEDLWNIQSVDLYLTKAAMNQPLLDTMFIRQLFVPVEDPDIWRLFSQSISATGGILGIKFSGNYTGILYGL